MKHVCNIDYYKAYIYGLFKLLNGYQRDNYIVFYNPQNLVFWGFFLYIYRLGVMYMENDKGRYRIMERARQEYISRRKMQKDFCKWIECYWEDDGSVARSCFLLLRKEWDYQNCKGCEDVPQWLNCNMCTILPRLPIWK